MKKRRTYKRFDLIAFLALIGCAAVLLFECIFVFERYDLLFLSDGVPDGQPVPSADPSPVSSPQGNSPASNTPDSEPVAPPPVG